MFNYEKNILIEGTPLCYRKYLFGLFPSTVHIKPVLQSIPKKKKTVDFGNRSDSYEEIILDDPYITMIDEDGGEDEMEEGMSEGEEDSMDLMDDDYSRGWVVFPH